MERNLVYQCFIKNEGSTLPNYVTRSTNWCKAYAEKVQADYMFSTSLLVEGADSENKIHRYYNILHVLDPMFDAYDNILYLDVDIIPHVKAKNIFSIVKPDVDLYMSLEDKVPPNITGPSYWGVPEMIKIFKDKYAKFGLIPPKNEKRPIIQYNTGVVIFPRHTRIFLRENIDPWIDWADDPVSEHRNLLNNDQPFLNGQIVKWDLKVHDMGYRWNLLPASCSMFPCIKAHFYHFSGDAKKYMLDFAPNRTPEGYYFHYDNEGYRDYPYPRE